MDVVEVREGEILLARHIPAADAWSSPLSFFSSDEEFIQVGTWGHPAGTVLKAHIHNPVTREVHWTQEVLFVRKGHIRAHIFDTAERKVADIDVIEGDILVLLRGGHGYSIIEEGTQVLEVKNGPYVGAERDRRRL